MVKKKSSAQCSQAGKALAECRWTAKQTKAKAKQTKAKAKKKKQTKAQVRKSRRLQGKAPITAKKKPKKKKAMKRSAASKKIENILVPGLNPKKGDMRSFLDQQRAMWL